MNSKNSHLLYYFPLLLVLAIALLYHGFNYTDSARIKKTQKRILALNTASKAKGSQYKDFVLQITAIQQTLSETRQDAVKKLFNEKFSKQWNPGKQLDTAQIEILTKEALHNAKDKTNNQWLAMLGIFLIGGGFLTLAFFSNLLKDAVSVPSTSNLNEAPYSLARTQVAVWISIIASLYIYSIFWRNCPNEDINQTALILMGISAATFVSGAIMDTVEIEKGMDRHQDYITTNSNFFKDILSDKDGISIHRFQNLVWTVVAIAIYFYRYNLGNACLPELDGTLLTLTGISNATYLTLKTRENTTPSSPDNKIFTVVLTPANPPNGFQGASVIFTNTATQATTTATLDPHDTTKTKFQVTNLTPGTYNITATLPPLSGTATNIVIPASATGTTTINMK